MKGLSYPKRSCQESSKTFHNTLGRKFTYVLTIELSRREGCSASTQKSFSTKIFPFSGQRCARDCTTAASRRCALPVYHRPDLEQPSGECRSNSRRPAHTFSFGLL